MVDQATKIGEEDLHDFKFSFFGPGVDMYMLSSNGSLRQAPSPTHASNNWFVDSKEISVGGWDRFMFLF